MTRVVISGIGCLTNQGVGIEATETALREGGPNWRPIDRSAGYHLARSARLGALTSPGDTSRWLPPSKARRMSPPSRLAAVAARMALEDAGIPPSSHGDPGTAVILATGYGPITNTELILRQILEEGPLAASPALFTESVANAPAAQVALLEKALGPNLTLTEREAGALNAVGLGAEEILAGNVERALVGSVEELTPLLHAILDRYHALARDDGRSEASRPFDLRRNGCVAGEGATVLLLETSESARARGHRPRTTLRARARAFDPTAPATGWGRDAARVAQRLRAQIETVGVELSSTDLIISGANGLRGGDAAVAAILKQTFGGRPRAPIVTPAAWLGAYCGNTLAAAVLGAQGTSFCPTPGFETPDPALGLQPHDGRALPPAPRQVLVEATAIGGGLAWLLLGPEDA